jgi:hypothetical protein
MGVRAAQQVCDLEPASAVEASVHGMQGREYFLNKNSGYMAPKRQMFQIKNVSKNTSDDVTNVLGS